MAIAAFDIGGTSVKYGLWNGTELGRKGSFPTPKTWDEMRAGFKRIFEEFTAEEEVTGAGFSFPGSVDMEKGAIFGLSAVPYIHRFPIRDELERELGVPVKMENDANSAALAELWRGAATEVKNALFVVVGTGVGGAVIVNRQIVRGMNLFGGEFGCMLLDDSTPLSMVGTPFQAANRYTEKSGETIDGKELFDRAERGDELAQHEVAVFQNALAQGIHNLLVCFNPELLVVGGAISVREDFLEQLTDKVNGLLQKTGSTDVEARIVPCTFHNDANLIGAVSKFELEP